MRQLGVPIWTVGWLALAEPSSATAAGAVCLSSGDAAEIVTARKIVAPREAIGSAHRAVPDGQVLRAALCRDPGALVYEIVVLRRDGRMMRVTVDAPSGKVRAIR